MNGSGMPGFPLYVLLMVIGVALIGYVLVRVLGGGLTGSSRRDDGIGDSRTADAFSILEQRYARGEIDAEEYERRRRTLQEGR